MTVVIENTVHEDVILERDWIRIQVDTIRFEGSDKEAERIILKHPGAACILPITDDNKVVMVSQYRYATGHTLYEIPAGKVDEWENRDFLETAKRELAEETPFTAENLEFLYSFFPVAAYCNEKIYMYKATGLKRNSQLELDDDEYLSLHYFTKAEAKEMLQTGKIIDAKTIIALQHWVYKDE